MDASEEITNSIPSAMDETRNRLTGRDCSLQEFLGRPIKLASYEWTPSTLNFFEKFDPWSLFLENPRVSNRISNYQLLKMKLHVKFVINGNSFFYGRLMACYQPFEELDELTVNTALSNFDNVQMSQFPRLFLDPTTSKGGEMVLPFFFYADYINVTTGDWDEMGKITIRTLNNLKHISGIAAANEMVSISVFAWASEVDLQAPTHTNAANITPQSGKDDEYKGNTGPISQPASAIAAASTALSAIPFLKPYATATAMVATLTARIASMFGYSSPVMVEEPQLVLLRSNTNMAVTNTPDAAAKLTVDVKQELSIDPRIVGLGGKDELDIAYIASRDSYLLTFDWVKGTDPDVLLQTMLVDPAIHRLNGDARILPACAGAVMPFQYWNGSMEYTFQIVASAFHRGRLGIVYDPSGTPNSFESNVAYTEIIDIATCREFTMKVGNHQSTGLMTHSIVGPTTSLSMYGTTVLVPTVGNGTISVFVINELTSSNTDVTVNDDIEINVFVRACEDFEVFVPDSEHYRLLIRPQSGVDELDETNQPYPTTDVTIGEPASIVSHRNLVFTGEKITSFRQLLKRYYHHSAFSFDAADTDDRLLLTQKAFPYYRGNVTGAIHTRAGPPTDSYNYAGMTMLNWLAPAFQAMRGSVRYKIVPKNNAAGYNEGKDTFYVWREDDKIYSVATDRMEITNPSKTSHESLFRLSGERKALGATVFNSHVNPVVEFEVPYYSNYRFSPGKRQNWTSTSYIPFNTGFSFLVEREKDGATYFDTWVSAGEDFTMYYFTGWPPLYYEATVPSPYVAP